MRKWVEIGVGWGYNRSMLTLVFGGAFDPPHNEHVKALQCAVKTLGAERVVVLPTYLPPHKGAGYLDFETRAELARLAFSEAAREVVVDDEERERGKDNYACLLLADMKKKYGDIAYLIGGDSLRDIDTWKHPEKIFAECPVVVAPREGCGDARAQRDSALKKYGGEIVLLDIMGEDVSSGRIKAKLLLGEECPDIPKKVAEYIKERGLFGEYAEAVRKLKGMESEELYAHSVAAVMRAVDLNSRHNLKQDFEKVFTAALLHDNAKQRPSLDGLAVPVDSVGTPVLHQFLGAEKAKRDFNVTDEDVLNAIRYHTTAKADMTTLEMLIYTADSTSYDREYDPIPELRAAVDEDFQGGFGKLLAFTYRKLQKKGGGVYPLTEEAVRYYLPGMVGER